MIANIHGVYGELRWPWRMGDRVMAIQPIAIVSEDNNEINALDASDITHILCVISNRFGNIWITPFINGNLTINEDLNLLHPLATQVARELQGASDDTDSEDDEG